MTLYYQKLSSKIVGILIVFFLVALIAISGTLLISWQLEGGAAAINDAGSERMRSYRIAFLLSRSIGARDPALRQEILTESGIFESTLAGLERGDPARPLSLPKETRVEVQMRTLRAQWTGSIKPLIESILEEKDPSAQERLMARYRPALKDFVGLVNDLVLMIEHSNAHNTTLLRSFQFSLVALALVGTVILIYLFFLLVIRPVTTLQQGIQRMAAADFSVRLPVESHDEFGELAQGFNQMADRLENLYATLEQRVVEKTRSLEEKNRELSTLYGVTAFLSEPASVEELCRGVLDKMMTLLGADGGTVRLLAPNSDRLHIVVQAGVSEDYVREEECLSLGECLCGESAQDGVPISWDFSQPTEKVLRTTCRRQGFEAVSAIPIRSKQQIIGIFNLFFRRHRVFDDYEIRLLETIGQHLGVAVENQRLVSREKEMTVSEERNLLAQELHDSIAQSLAFLNIQVQLLQDSLKRGDAAEAMEGLAQIREGVQESYDDVRELLVHFRTRVEHGDLEGAIRSALEKFEGQTGIKTAFHRAGEGTPIAPEFIIQVLHIIQEALSNVRKHAQASQVDVEMSQNGEYRITVRDDGKGFDPEATGADAETHVGLKIMKERAHRIGGQLAVASAPGGGTRVTLILPGQLKGAA